MLADSFGRVATDLRVSLTDRCNLRCAYCMPPEGLDWLPSPELLTDDEVVRLRRGAGEPLGARAGTVTRAEPPRRPALARRFPPHPGPAARPLSPPTTH